MAKIYKFKAEIPADKVLNIIEHKCTEYGIKMERAASSGTIEGMGVKAAYETQGNDTVIVRLLRIPFIVSWGKADTEVMNHAGEFDLTLMSKEDA